MLRWERLRAGMHATKCGTYTLQSETIVHETVHGKPPRKLWRLWNVNDSKLVGYFRELQEGKLAAIGEHARRNRVKK